MEKLSKDNYVTWCLQTQAMLIKNGTWEIVNGEIPRPSNPTGTETEQTQMQSTLTAWIAKDRKAKADLILSIDPTELPQIFECETSHQIWKKLQSIHVPSRQKTTLLKQLIQHKMIEEDDVVYHIDTFLNIVNKLEAINVKIHKDLLSGMLLYSLPKSYESFQRAVENQDVLPKLDNLRNRILEEAKTRNQPSTSKQLTTKLVMKDVKQNSEIAVAEPNLNLHQNPNLNTKKVENPDIQPFCNEKKSNKCFFENVKNIEAFFNSTKTFALAFCVSEDLGMDNAVAVQFNTKFQQMHNIYEQGQKEGGLAILQINGRFIYYLITRKQRDGKATTNAMLNSLQKLQQHIQKHNVKNLAILRLGCDLDCFKWIAVRGMIEHTFEKTAVKITIYNSERPEEDTKKSETIKCLTWHVSCPLTDMHSGAAIIYFGTVNGHISKEIHSLDMQFQIMGDYVRANKMLGDVIQVYKNQGQYMLLGCITRTTRDDSFNFTKFQECLVQIKKVTENIYRTVSIKAFCDDRDDLLLDKIINMLRYSLQNIELYVCWADKI